jgi:hypothetical protein
LQRYCVVQAGDRAHVQPMTENWKLHFPEQLSEIRRATEAAGFRMASDELTGSLLRGLAASRPKGSPVGAWHRHGHGHLVAAFRDGRAPVGTNLVAISDPSIRGASTMSITPQSRTPWRT